MKDTLKTVQRDMRSGFTAVPLVRELPADLLTPVSAYLGLSRKEKYSFLLESVEGGERIARYSFLGARPFETLAVRNGKTTATRPDGEIIELKGSPLEALAARTGMWKAPQRADLPRFSGGAVGKINYELAGRLEPTARLRHTEEDEARLMMYDRVVAFDRLRQRVQLVAHVRNDGRGLARNYRAACDALDEMEQSLRRPVKDAAPKNIGRMAAPNALLGRAAFMEKVRRLKRHIAAGDIFQAVVSERFEVDLKASSLDVYRALRSINPSPYMFYLSFGDEQALGASPEMLTRVEDGLVETHPIAGTRRRGATEAEDKKFERSMLASVKERAEHTMLVDLGRNDVGRVARPGTVEVPTFMKVERYSRVMHLVSRVTGKLKSGLTPWDAFAACFPAGTVTGAPKIRAMQLVAEMEPVPRGLYAGAIVYCDFHGNLDSAIAIRSMLARGRKGFVQAGAGIVADSDPGREYDEARNKAHAMLRAAAMAGRAA